MIKLEKILEQKLSEIEELYDSDFSAKDHLQRLKKQRAEQKYTKEVRYQMLESYVAPHPFDFYVQKIEQIIDQAIDNALDEGESQENYQKVNELIRKQNDMHIKIHATTVYNKKNGCYEPSENVWLYHFVRTRAENPIYPYH